MAEQKEGDRKELAKGYFTLQSEQGKLIGKGAFGEVFKCYNTAHPGQVFAAKKVTLAPSSIAYQYLLDEITLLEKLKECKLPNVVGYYDSFQLSTDQHGSIVTILIFEYCEGGDYESLITNKAPFSEADIKLLLRPIAEGLSALHERVQLIHRDVKPANFLLQKPWMAPNVPLARICDFGVSAQGQQTAASMVGTYDNMAPEMASMESLKRVDYNFKVDIFAFGTIFYRMLYGTYPVPGKMSCFWSAVPWLRFPRARKLSAECFDLLQRCLRVNPEHRPSFREILNHPFFHKNVHHTLLTVFDRTEGVLFYDMGDPAPTLLENPPSDYTLDPIWRLNQEFLEGNPM